MHVPSRFSGTEDLLNPAVYQAKVGAQAQADVAPFCAPFNRLSRFREPGRVNINGLRDGNYSVHVSNARHGAPTPTYISDA